MKGQPIEMPQTKSHGKRKQIKDKLYGYVEFSPLELQVIDHPLFQRLKHIRQLGFAFNAYPSADHKRFEHSIGVAFVATEIMEAILNADNEDLKSWMDMIYKALTQYYKANLKKIDLEDLLKTIVRLAALLHDIGHLPFSHTFEIALEPILHTPFVTQLKMLTSEKGKKIELLEDLSYDIQIHERIGHMIILNHFSEILNQIGSWLPKFLCDIFELNLLKEPHPFAGVLVPLQKIVNGPLDADRIDYVARDHYSSGIRLGDFDRERLVSNLRIVKKDQNNYDLALRMKALSAVNSFILMRSMMYRHLYQHHLVSMYDNVFAIMVEMMFIDAHLQKNFADLIAFFTRLSTGELNSFVGKNPDYLTLTNKFSGTPQWLVNNPVIPVDDIALMSTLRMYMSSVFEDFSGWKERMKSYFGTTHPIQGFHNPYSLIQNPLSLFEAFNNRGKTPVALWNNYRDYTEIVIQPVIEELEFYLTSKKSSETTASLVESLFNEDAPSSKLKDLKKKLRSYLVESDFLKKIHKHIAEEIIIQNGFNFDKTSFYDDNVPPGKFDIYNDLYMTIVKEGLQPPENIIISAKFPRTYSERISFVDIVSGDGEIRLEDISPFVAPLKHKVQDQPFFYVYIQHADLSREELKTKIRQYRKAMRKAIRQWLKRKTKPRSSLTNLEYLFRFRNP